MTDSNRIDGHFTGEDGLPELEYGSHVTAEPLGEEKHRVDAGRRGVVYHFLLEMVNLRQYIRDFI